jgi:hypothetical protein
MKSHCRIRPAIKRNSTKKIRSRLLRTRFPYGARCTAAIVVHIVMALLGLIRMKRLLLRRHPLHQFLNPIERSLIGDPRPQTLVMLDLAVEFDAPVTHSDPPFLGREKRPLSLLRLSGSFVSTHRALFDQSIANLVVLRRDTDPPRSDHRRSDRSPGSGHCDFRLAIRVE